MLLLKRECLFTIRNKSRYQKSAPCICRRRFLLRSRLFFTTLIISYIIHISNKAFLKSFLNLYNKTGAFPYNYRKAPFFIYNIVLKPFNRLLLSCHLTLWSGLIMGLDNGLDFFQVRGWKISRNGVLYSCCGVSKSNCLLAVTTAA